MLSGIAHCDHSPWSYNSALWLLFSFSQ